MNSDHKYSLASGKVQKLDCPYCGAKRHWQRYVDTETGEALPDQYGRCDNESRCGAWLDPYKDGYAKMIWEQERAYTDGRKSAAIKINRQPKPEPKPVHFDQEVFRQTLQEHRYDSNTFLYNLLHNVSYPIEIEMINAVIEMYSLGTVTGGYMKGSVTFPFIDKGGNVRAVQAKLFDADNHTTHTNWLHSMIAKYHEDDNSPLPQWIETYREQGKLVTCLFGEHLLSRYPDKPVALVEAPKTAVYGSLYFPDMLWLAVFNKSSFTKDKLEVLRGRRVTVFPDLSEDGGTFREWETKAKEYQKQIDGVEFIFSDMLEQLATPEQRECGADIADVLIELDWRIMGKNRPINLSTTLALLQEYEPHLGVTDDMITNPLHYEKEIRGVYRTMHEMGHKDFAGKY